jgi:hypothetical protein
MPPLRRGQRRSGVVVGAGPPVSRNTGPDYIPILKAGNLAFQNQCFEGLFAMTSQEGFGDLSKLMDEIKSAKDAVVSTDNARNTKIASLEASLPAPTRFRCDVQEDGPPQRWRRHGRG